MINLSSEVSHLSPQIFAASKKVIIQTQTIFTIFCRSTMQSNLHNTLCVPWSKLRKLSIFKTCRRISCCRLQWNASQLKIEKQLCIYSMVGHVLFTPWLLWRWRNCPQKHSPTTTLNSMYILTRYVNPSVIPMNLPWLQILGTQQRRVERVYIHWRSAFYCTPNIPRQYPFRCAKKETNGGYQLII